MSDGVHPDLPTLAELHAQREGALEQLRQVLGERPREVATAGELANLLARITADTPLTISQHVRIDPELDEGGTETRLAIATTTDMTFTGVVTQAVDEHGYVDLHTVQMPALHLGAVWVARDATVPAHTVAYGATERVIEAMHTADGDRMMTALQELILEVAGRLDGLDDGALLEWLSDQELVRDLQVEGSRLRHSAARLGALHARILADLVTQDTDGPDDTDV